MKGSELPPPCEYRILMSTKTARHLDEATLYKVQKHLSRSEGTRQAYYEFILTEDATHAHKALKYLTKKQLKQLPREIYRKNAICIHDYVTICFIIIIYHNSCYDIMCYDKLHNCCH